MDEKHEKRLIRVLHLFRRDSSSSNMQSGDNSQFRSRGEDDGVASSSAERRSVRY